MRDYNEIHDLFLDGEEFCREMTSESYNRGYTHGYEDGVKDASIKDDKEIMSDQDAYKKGLEQGWNCAQIIATTPKADLANMGFVCADGMDEDEYSASCGIIDQYNVHTALKYINENKRQNDIDGMVRALVLTGTTKEEIIDAVEKYRKLIKETN